LTKQVDAMAARQTIRCEACSRVTDLYYHRGEDAYFCEECFELVDKQMDLFDDEDNQ
jgi:hypothetical protein